MKILLYGENWEGTHVDSISKVLTEKKITHQIFDFYSIIHKNFNNRILNKIIREINYKRNEKLINSLFLKNFNEYKPKVVLISKGVNIYPETLFEMQRSGAKIVNWNPDDFFNQLNTSKNLLNSLELFDTIYSARKHLFEEYKLKGIKNPVYLEWYYIPWLHKKIDTNLSFSKKVTFVGSYSKRRQEIIENINSNFEIEVWGAGWNFSKLHNKKNLKINKILKQSEFPEVLSKCSINLNILTIENRDQTNLKVFEIPASNGFLLSEKTDAISQILEDEIDCIFFDPFSSTDLNNKIRGIFEMKDEDYLSLRRNGYQKIVNNKNSIVDRVDFILNDLSR